MMLAVTIVSYDVIRVWFDRLYGETERDVLFVMIHEGSMAFKSPCIYHIIRDTASTRLVKQWPSILVSTTPLESTSPCSIYLLSAPIAQTHTKVFLPPQISWASSDSEKAVSR